MPIAGIGPATSPLPRECSATEPNGPFNLPINANFDTNRTVERETGIEPASLAWKARVLPLNYSRVRAASQQPQNFAFHACPAPYLHYSWKPVSLNQWVSDKIFAGGEGWIRTSVLVRGQIYSLLPLTTRPPLLWRTADYAMQKLRVKPRDQFTTALLASHRIGAWPCSHRKLLACRKWPHPTKGTGARLADKGDG